MGPVVFERYMGLGSELDNPSDVEDHGLRFINEDWNGSIANGQGLTLRWNESIEGEGAGLKLFRVRYPEDGKISFELVSNLTESMDEISCYWTPENLNDDSLYALWVTRNDGDEQQWAFSPPWKPSEPDSKGFHWTNPIGIPIVVILGVYFISLGTCLMYRRRKRIKREKEHQRKQETTISTSSIADADRHPSVSSVVTVQTLTEEDELVKKDEDRTWIVMNPPEPRSPSHGIQWNTMMWRNDHHAGYGGEPEALRGEHTWADEWYEGPIGQAR